MERDKGDPRKEAHTTVWAVTPNSAEGFQTGALVATVRVAAKSDRLCPEPEKLRSGDARAAVGLAGEAEPLLDRGEWNPRIAGSY